MADTRKLGTEDILTAVACGVGMGFLGGIAIGGISGDWSLRDVALGPAVGAGLALLVIVLREKLVLQVCILAFLGGLAGKLPMQNAKENLLKVNLMLQEKKIEERIALFKEVPPNQQRAALAEIVDEYAKLMGDAATLRDKRAAEGFGERLGLATSFLAGFVERSPEMALVGLGRLRKAAADARNRGVWEGATKLLEEAAKKTPDAGIRNRARNILNDTKSPFDQEAPADAGR